MNFLKIIGKFFAGLFVLLGITVLIMSYFGSYAVNNFSILVVDIFNKSQTLIERHVPNFTNVLAIKPNLPKCRNECETGQGLLQPEQE